MSLALLFSPQGSQLVGMGRDLADASPAAADVFVRADAALGWAVSDVCWNGPAEHLNDTRQTQPCLVATSLACLAALREAAAASGLDIIPSLVAGHSVGEYAAIAAAGAVANDDALQMVALRGSLMAEAGGDGGMTAVIGIDRATIDRVLETVEPEGSIVVANDNAPGQVVVSGTSAALATADQLLRDAGAKRLIVLKVSGPFHSLAMAPVGESLAAAFGRVAWSDAAPPVVSNVTAEPVIDAKRIRELLERQVSSPVEWVATIRRMIEEGVDTFVECGPGTALTGMVRRIAPDASTLNVSDAASLQQTVAALQSVAELPARASV